MISERNIKAFIYVWAGQMTVCNRNELETLKDEKKI